MFVIMRVSVRMHGAIAVAMLVFVGRAVVMRVDVMRRLRVFPRSVGLAVDHHIDLCRCNAAAVDARDLQLGSEVQRADGFAQQVGGNAGIDESAEKHISADTREAFDVGDTHETETKAARFLQQRCGRRTESFIVGQRAPWGQTARFATITISSAI